MTVAQPPDNLIPRELLFREKDRHRITLSKDGQTVFYQKRADGADSTLYFVGANAPGTERSRRFDGVLLNYLSLYQNGLLAVVRQQDNNFVFYTTPGSTTARKLDVMPFKELWFMATSERFPNKAVIRIDAKNERESGIYLLDVLSGSMKRLGAMGNFTELFFDGNFGMVAALQPNDLGGHTLLRRWEGEWFEVFKHPQAPDMFIGGLNKIVSVSADGRTIYATDNTGKDKTSLVAIETDTGTVTELIADADADILPFGATISPAGKPTTVVSLWGDTKRHFLDAALKKDFDFLEKELKANFGIAAASSDDNVWLVRKMDGGPLAYSLYDRAKQKLTPLFTDYSHLEGFDLATRKALTVVTRDSLRLPVHIYVPPGMSKTDGMPKVALPTIIYVHGGPWAGVTHWNSWFHNRNFQLLANRGYVVINMEFRGTTGLGKKMTDAANQQWGDAMHNDIVDVANWAVKNGIANRRRMGIWGWSYGGYAANFALAKSPDLFACGISLYGISDLYAFCQTPFADNDTWRTRVGDPKTDTGAALLKAHSPITLASQVRSPLLLTTGTLDDRVPQEQSDVFAKTLHDTGREVIYFYYPEEGHDYEKPESWISFWAIAEHFLHKKIGGRKEIRKGDLEKGNFKVMFGQDYIDEMN